MRELRNFRNFLLKSNLVSQVIAKIFYFIPSFLRLRLPISGNGIGFINFQKFYWRLDPRELISQKYFSRGFRDYEPQTQKYLNSKLLDSPGIHFLNVGANTGLWGLLIGKKFPSVEITLIEPVPTNLEFLLHNIRSNGINARILPFALEDNARKTEIFIDQSLLGMATLKKHEGNESQESVVVQVVKGDDLSIRSVQIILIDVEGSEFEVLNGMRNLLTSCMPIVIVEISSGNFDGIRNLMLEIGYLDPIWLGDKTRFGPGEKNFAFEPRTFPFVSLDDKAVM